MVRRLGVLFGATLRAGDPIGRLRIPAIDLDRLVQQGSRSGGGLDPDADRKLLRSGPVHYAVTPLPGVGDPFAVAGHRTTYGAPFYRLDKLERGDAIFVDTPYARFRYAVAKTTVVLPDGRRCALRPRLRPGADHLHAAVQRQPPPHRLGGARARHAAQEGAGGT